jgi:Domain of unknown function (DUF4158)
MLGLDELVDHWTVLDDERKLIAGKRGPTRLGFTLLLKFYTQHGRFPSGRSELPDEAVEFVAKQVKVPASDMGFYEWSGSTLKNHAARSASTWASGSARSPTRTSSRTGWPLMSRMRSGTRTGVREELLRRCRAERIEPPTPDRVTRIVRSALHNAEETWFAVIAGRISAETVRRIIALIDGARKPATLTMTGTRTRTRCWRWSSRCQGT